MREVDDLFRHRPGLGILVGEARTFRAQFFRDRGSGVPGASAPDRSRAERPSRNQAVAGPVNSASWRDGYPAFHPVRGMEPAPA